MKKVWEVDVYVVGVVKRCRRESQAHFKIAEVPFTETIDLEAFKTEAMIMVKARMKSYRKVQVVAMPVTLEELPTSDGSDAIVIRSMAISFNNPKLNIELESAVS